MQIRSSRYGCPMGQIRAALIQADENRSTVRVHGLADEPAEMWVESEGQLSPTLSGWVPVLTVLASATGNDLHLDGIVDPVGVENAVAAQGLLNRWFPDRMGQVEITAPQVAPEMGGSLQAALFSGGADSFYTVQQHLDEVRHLLFIHGTDIKLNDEQLFQQVHASLEQAATEMGSRLVVARTNIRSVMDRYADWALHYHGAAIATVAQLHSPMWHRVFIGASYPLDQQIPLGSHPDLDPLWSNGGSQVVHDGAIARSLKLEALGRWDVAMNHLRVCWLNAGGAYNCGRCSKCTRTMVSLHIVGALERCRTMPAHLNYQMVWSMVEGHARSRLFISDNLRFARTMRPRDWELEAALTFCLVRNWYRSTPIASTVGRARRQVLALVRSRPAR